MFTDIEGSTRLLRRLGDEYPDVLKRHRDLLRSCWTRFDGVEVSTDGDACFAVFVSATAAVRACLAGQGALAAAAWPTDGRPMVRMGVHGGVAFPRDDDYVALAVHQAARVVTAAHGGQVVVSEDTMRAAASELDQCAVPFVELGRYRLRDFDGPVTLFQAGSRESFPGCAPFLPTATTSCPR